MRWLFVLLILLNAGFFVWQYSMQESSEARPVTTLALPPDSSIKPLVLLREVSPAAPKDASTEENTPQQATPVTATTAVRPPTPTESCYTIGPFFTAQEAQRANTMLETDEITPHLRADGTPDNPEYWLDIDSDPEQSLSPVSATLWQTLVSTFTDIQQQSRACQ